MNETDMPTAMRVATTDGLGFGGAAKVAFARFHNRGGFVRDDRKAQSTMDHGRHYWGRWLWSSFEARNATDKNAADRSDRDVPAEGSDNARAGLQGKFCR